MKRCLWIISNSIRKAARHLAHVVSPRVPDRLLDAVIRRSGQQVVLRDLRVSISEAHFHVWTAKTTRALKAVCTWLEVR